MTQNELQALVKKCLPADGDLKFRTFTFPRKTAYYSTGSNWVPLRCWPGDIRCGVAVYDGDKPILVWAIERQERVKNEETFEAELRHAIGMALDNTMASLTGKIEPHGVKKRSLTDEEVRSRR